MTITAPGFYDIDAEAYHADPAPKPSLSSGLLARVVSETVAAAHESHPRLNPPEPDEEEADEKRFDLGTVAHTLVLGRGRQIVPVDAKDWRGKDAKQARADARELGSTAVLLHQYERAMAMREALFHQLADIPSEQDTFCEDVGVAEQAAFWQQPTPMGQMWCRSLIDWRRTDRLVIRDYKTWAGEKGADPDGFVQGLLRTGKDVQDPFHSTGLAALHDGAEWEDVDFAFIVQDPSPPYLVSVVKLDDRRWHYERMRWAIDRWAAAAAANLWRGFVPETHYVTPPAWAKIQWEQRMLREFEGEQRGRRWRREPPLRPQSAAKAARRGRASRR